MPASPRIASASEGHWVALAGRYGVRLPRRDAKMTTAGLKRAVAKAGLAVQDLYTWGGYRSVRDFIDLNPDWSLRAFQGLMLELRAERDGHA